MTSAFDIIVLHITCKGIGSVCFEFCFVFQIIVNIAALPKGSGRDLSNLFLDHFCGHRRGRFPSGRLAAGYRALTQVRAPSGLPPDYHISPPFFLVG